MLEYIIQNYKEKSWLRLCETRGIDKWELIDKIRKPVYSSVNFIGSEYSVDTRQCLYCGTKFDLNVRKGAYYIKKMCGCKTDSSTVLSRDKLMCFYAPEIADAIINKVFDARTSGFDNRIDYWIAMGYSEEDAKIKSSDIQHSRSSKSPASQKGASEYSVRCMGYWLKQGFSEEDAKHKVKEVQITNGIDVYIKKYGIDIGTVKYNSRISEWQNKMVGLSVGISKVSIELFSAIDPDKTGLYGENETTVWANSKAYRVDYYNKTSRKIIEFYGQYWHADPAKYKPTDYIRKKLVSDIWSKDATKKLELENAGFDVLIIHESDYYKNKDLIITECKEFLG